MAKQIVEAVMVEHSTSILLFKPKNGVRCHQSSTLEEVIGLVERYASVCGVGLDLISKAWRNKEGKMGHKSTST